MVVLISSDEDDLSEGGSPGSLKKTAGLPKDKVSVIRPFCYVGKGGTERKEVRGVICICFRQDFPTMVRI